MDSKKTATILALFILSSFFHLDECYIGILDATTYRTVTGFADECVQLFKNRKLRKRVKKVNYCNLSVVKDLNAQTKKGEKRERKKREKLLSSKNKVK